MFNYDRFYVNSCADEVEKLLNQINDQALQFLEEEKTIPSKNFYTSKENTNTTSKQELSSPSPSLTFFLSKLFKLTKEWNYAMQVLSSIFSPHQPIVLTRKPFSERWHLSALVMWVR